MARKVALVCGSPMAVLVLALAGNTQVASGAVAKAVAVKGQTTFQIDPSAGFPQYAGDLDYTKVAVLRPRNGTLTKRVMRKARKRCLNLFIDGESEGLFPHVEIYDDGGARRLSTPGGYEVSGSGRWVRSGFNSSPGEKVFARVGFWTNEFYNSRRTDELATFKHQGKDVQAECDGKIDASRNYPAT